MSSHEIQLYEDQCLDKLIRWALVDAVAGGEPSPQVWQDIEASIMTRSQAVSSRSEIRQPLRQLVSSLWTWTSSILAPCDTNWDPKLTSQERSYLIWRENLSLLIMPMAVRMVY